MKSRRIAAAAVIAAVSAWLILGMVPAASATPTSSFDGDFQFTADASNIAAGAQITAYSGGAVADIPDTVTDGTNVWTVTSIGETAFFEDPQITTVTIPSTVTSIGDAAFLFDSITAVTLPADLTELGSSAFEGNDLTTVEIPAGVTVIPEEAFTGNPLTSVSFDGPVTELGRNSFSATQLASFTIPSTVTTIDDFALNNNSLESLVIPASVVSIGDTIVNSSVTTEVDFAGAPPATFTAAGGAGSLGAGPLPTVGYLAAYASPVFSGGFTSGTWDGYTSEEIAGVTVSFDLNGHGTAIASQTTLPGYHVTKPADPIATGFTFGGWYTNTALTDPADFTAAVAASETFYAKWTAVAGTTKPTLATTGVDVSPLAIPGAIALVALGLALVLRRKRSALSR